MTTESTTTTQTGGFAGDPFAALNPPTASSGCCSSEQTIPASTTGCCPDAAPTADAGCC